MNHTLKTRSALVRHAERGLGISGRPTAASDVVCAARRERARHASQQILAVCITGIAVMLLAVFIGQVFA